MKKFKKWDKVFVCQIDGTIDMLTVQDVTKDNKILFFRDGYGEFARNADECFSTLEEAQKNL